VSKLTTSEKAAEAVRDATLAELLSWAGERDAAWMKELVLRLAAEHGEISANLLRKHVEEHLHWLIAPAIHSLLAGHRLVRVGDVPSDSPATKGHRIGVYRRPQPPAAGGVAA